MMAAMIEKIEGRGIPLPGDDIDTDRVIPARFLKCVTFEGIGQYAFYDERFDEKGSPKKHPLNDPRFRGGDILVVGKNFGCGSSREHAPQSLMRFGIRALIGESFAEIFAGNCTPLGIPAVRLGREEIGKIMAYVGNHPDTRIEIDLDSKKVSVGREEFSLNIPEAFRQSLLSGTWDSTQTLLLNRVTILQKAKKIPYLHQFQI